MFTPQRNYVVTHSSSFSFDLNIYIYIFTFLTTIRRRICIYSIVLKTFGRWIHLHQAETLTFFLVLNYSSIIIFMFLENTYFVLPRMSIPTPVNTIFFIF